MALALVAAGCAPAELPQVTTSQGERAYQKCYSCHALEAGKNDLGGPTLFAIVGRRVAAQDGFDYSPALRRFATQNPVWTRELLDSMAKDPEALVPGTSMAFTGVPDEEERRVLIDYLSAQTSASEASLP
jgi:cytochrome c